MGAIEYLSVRSATSDLVEDLMKESTVVGNPWSEHVRFQEFSPAINVRETPSQVLVFAELPGVEEGDVHLSVNRGYIVIRGEKRLNEQEGPNDYGHFERVYGRFSRVIKLPDDADESRVSAILNRGILRLRIDRLGVIDGARQ